MDQKNINYGNDQYVIYQPNSVTINTPSRPSRPRNELLILQAVDQEVNSRLAQSLHNHVFVTLNKEAHPEQVKRLWDTEVKIGAKPPVPIPLETSILNVFEQPEIAGQMLILGDPGAGKTTTMLDLAKPLVDKAEQDPNEPIPVLVNLSSWQDPKQLMPDWLVGELKSKYGVPKDVGKKWLEDKLLLPMLDGLDEVKPKHQESCVNAINLWLQGDLRPTSIVVCSSREEYANYQAQLSLNGAILLQALTNQQIQVYLSGVNRTELWQILEQDTELLELVRTPLLLSITILSYAELSLQKWHELTSTKQRVELLLDAYIRAMFGREFRSGAYRKRQPPSALQTQHWLSVLALQMQRESQTEFLIEKMQPSLWLSDKQKGVYRLIFVLIGGLIGGLIFGLSVWLSVGLSFGLFFGLSSGLIFGLSSGLIRGLIGEIYPAIEVVETLNWSLKRASSGLIGGLIFGLSGGLIFVLIFGLIFVLIFVLIGGLIFGLIGSEVDVKSSPNQGIWKSASNALFITVFFGLISGLINGLISGLINGLISGLSFGLISGLSFGLSGGLIFGGKACIQHFTLRLILFRSGSIPWNYARFLNYCTKKLFLQRVGGRYRFIYRLLQEHFAEMDS